MSSQIKNSYLQHKYKMNPITLNYAVKSGLRKLKKESFESFSKLSLFSTSKENVLCNNINQYTLGFGRTGLDRMIDELSSPDVIYILLPALTALMDLVHDSEKAFYLISHGVIDRLYNLLTPSDLEDNIMFSNEIKKKVCNSLGTLANLYQGNLAIIGHQELIERIKTMLVEEDDNVIAVAAQLVNVLCKNILLAEKMAVNYFFTLLLMDIIENDNLVLETRMVNFDSFISLLEYDQNTAIENRGIERMLNLLSSHFKLVEISAMHAISIMIIYLEENQDGHKINPLIAQTIEFFLFDKKIQKSRNNSSSELL